ncbi:hypothetical protein GCM10010448_62680 [Streptomyces glomeratus]|uniref:Tetratricopeptide repeat protein n=1 Tax=Streptomyces glomeratus TaxID=284452 RepID=A0ABP6M0Y9_9ACTN
MAPGAGRGGRITASNLAVRLAVLGRTEEARTLGEDTLTRRRRVLGEDHPDTLATASNLAIDLAALGQLDAAREDPDTGE